MPPRDEIDVSAPGSILGRGLSWPLREDENTGDFARAADEDHVQSCIESLIHTPLGLIPGKEDVGTEIDSLLFETDMGAHMDLVGESVRRAIERFEPRVTLMEARFRVEIERNRPVVYCNPVYRIKRTGRTALPTFPFSFRTGEEQ